MGGVTYEATDVRTPCAAPRIQSISWARDGTGGAATYTPYGLEYSNVGGYNCPRGAGDGYEGGICAPSAELGREYPHFDNILWSFLSLFQISTLYEWSSIMYDAQVKWRTKNGSVFCTRWAAASSSEA